jgi:hypothetical protein
MAVRDVVVVLAAAVSVTTPLAVPLSELTVIQLAPFVTVQPHPPVEVTVTATLPPFPDTVAVVGEIEDVQAGAAACVTVTACPAIVTVALRLAVPVFAVAVSRTAPLPVPPAGLSVIQEAGRVVPEVAEVVPEEARVVPVDAVQLQPDAVVTLSEALPPLAPIEAAVGVTA